MPTANAILQDLAIDRAHDLQRFGVGVVQRIVAVLNRADASLATQLTEALMRLERDSFTVERLESLLTSVRRVNAQAYAAVLEALQPELAGLAKAETASQLATYKAAIPSVVQIQFPIAGISWEQAYAVALSRPFQGRLLKDWAANLEQGRLTLIRNTVRAGIVEGQTTADIIRKIRGTRALRYADGLLQRPRHELAAVVQTAISHTAQTTRQVMTDANADLVKATRWVSTLDTRTSPMCRVRDGLEYTPDTHKPIGHSVPWGDGPGRLHFNAIPSGALVATSTGLRPIESVREGDLVLTHKGRFKPVTDARSKVNESGIIRVIHMESGAILRATDDHPVYVANRGWVFVGTVKVGDAMFRDFEQSVEVARASSEVVANAEDCPSAIDEDAVALRRTFELVASRVDFKGDFHLGPCEVENVILSGVLENPSVIECESNLHQLFALADMLDQYGHHRLGEFLARTVTHDVAFHAQRSAIVESGFSFRLHDALHDLGVLAGVVRGHALRVAALYRARFFCLPVCPVVDAGWSDMRASGEVNADLIAFAANRDAVPFSEHRQRAIGEAVLPLDGAKGQTLRDVEIENQSSVVRFSHDRVHSIEVQDYSSTVHDLAVLDDASYVCNSIVVSNCRSVSVPVLKSWRELGIPIDDMPPGQRASMDGAVPADMTYSQWFLKQSDARQREVLGVRRYDLWKSGKVSVDDFYNDKGVFLTLAQLMAKS